MLASLFDWIARVVGLVLAMMVTLSIIGAIAAIPSGPIGGRLSWERPDMPWSPTEAPPTGTEAPPPERRSPADRQDVGETTIEVETAGPEEAAADPAAWLEVIAYALIALACMAALFLLFLWRMIREMQRMTEALQRSAAEAQRRVT